MHLKLSNMREASRKGETDLLYLFKRTVIVFF